MDTSEAHGKSIILYDGVCGLCNRLNVFVLKRDSKDRFRFASLQSALAKEILQRYQKDPSDLDTVYLVLNHGTTNEKLLSRSNAILEVLSRLNAIWSTAGILKIIPRPLRDVAYRFVAKTRYRVFGKYETCVVPDKKWKEKFLDL